MPETRIIAALAYPDVQLLDITGPLETFNLAGQQLMDDGQSRSPAYRSVVIAKRGPAPRSMSGLVLQPERCLEDPVDDIDTLIIPGGLTGGYKLHEDPQHIEWLRAVAGKVRRLGSVCSGAFLLAAAGCLQGRRATTHWMDAEQLRQEFPGVRVEANRIYLEDRGVYTSGGITAGIDLALAMIEQDHSRSLALQVAKRLLVYLKRPGDQSQFSSFLAAQVQPGPFEAVLDWMTEHLDQPIDTSILARRAFMSERTFQRKFEAHLEEPLSVYLRRARVNKARCLLETTHNRIAMIARQCGFTSVDSMRYAFASELGVTPSDYRQRFGEASGQNTGSA